MRNDGKNLEALIGEIEKITNREDCNIEINQRKYDQEGNQLAEFDIILSFLDDGKKVEWLYECRDRKETNNGGWIEQLIGRKFLNNFKRVTAVSTATFSPAAIHNARKGDIELRTVEHLPYPDQTIWRKKTKLITYENTGSLLHLELFLYPDTSGELKEYIKNNFPQKNDELYLCLDDCLDVIKAINLFQNICSHKDAGVYDVLEPNVPKDVVVVFEHDENERLNVDLLFNNKRFCVILNHEEKDVHKMNIRIKDKTMPVKKIIFYGNSLIKKHEDMFLCADAIKNISGDTIKQKIVTKSDSGFRSEIYENLNSDGSRTINVNVFDSSGEKIPVKVKIERKNT